MQSIKVRVRLLIALVFCAMAFVPAHAQTITGDVNGTVTDAAGAVIPGATVTAVNVDTGVAVPTTTNAAGIYSIRFLQIGNYTVTAVAKGFEKNSVGPFSLASGQIAKIDAKLTVGSSSTTVKVSGNFAPLINTENGTVDTIIDTNQIQNIPLSGENFNSLTLFLPGAVTTTPTSFIGAGNGESIGRSTNNQDTASINGGRLQQNDYLLDGIETMETINNVNSYNPYPDAIGEIRVISANAPAEYGNVNGGDVLISLKSGTNAFHGSASFNLQDYLLDANSWGNKHVTAGSAVLPRTPYTQSIFGGTIGGPIIKDKLFFFADYLGDRYHTGGLSDYTVLSPDMDSGNFSELLNPSLMCPSSGCASGNNNLTQLYDPQNAPYNLPFQNNIVCGATTVPTGYATEAATPCSAENPVFNFIVNNPKLYPAANHAPNDDSPISNNYVGASSSYTNNNQFDVKIDYTPSRKDRISSRWLQGKSTSGSTSPILTSFPGVSVYPDKGIANNWVHTFNPALINEARAGYTRVRWEGGIPTDPSGAFGLTGDNKVGIPVTSQPYVGFASQSNGFSSMGTGGSGTIIIDNTFEYADDLTWQHEKHLFKFGAQFLRYQQNQFYPGNTGDMGNFTFNGQYTSNPAITAQLSATPNTNTYSASGYTPADWVLDRVENEGIGAVTGNTGDRSWRSAYFAQDDWKLTRQLTLNIGLRYEYVQPIYEAHNKQANVLPGGTVEYAGSVPTASATIVLPVSYNSTPVHLQACPTRSCYSDPYNQFSPRLGFAYQVRNNWVVRGGYGMTNFMEGTGANLRLFYNPPFTPSFLVTGTAPANAGGGAVNPGSYFTETNGFNTGSVSEGGTTYRQWQQNMHPGVIAEYDLVTEYQLNNYSSFKIGYIGESGQHLILAGAANQLQQPCIINGVVSSSPEGATCQAADPSPYQNLVSQSGSIVGTFSTGMMNYNALQASYHQRATKGLEFTGNYTYGRAMTNTEGFFGVPGINGPSAYAENYYDNHAEYGRVGQDTRNNFSATGVYELPVGRGRQFMSHDPLWLDEVIGGWKYSQTAIVYTGFPVTVSALTNDAYTDNNAQRANFVQKFKVTNRSLVNWFGTDSSLGPLGTTAFAEPAPGTYGNSKVGTLNAPGYREFDLSLTKDFTIYRQQKLSFRANMFNFSNTASWNNPGNQEGSTSFGEITGVRSPNRNVEFALKYTY